MYIFRYTGALADRGARILSPLNANRVLPDVVCGGGGRLLGACGSAPAASEGHAKRRPAEVRPVLRGVRQRAGGEARDPG